MKLTENLFYYPEHQMLDSNTYVIKDNTTVLFDPGLEQALPALVEDMKKDGINPEDIDIIANTHLHGDHCWADEPLKSMSGARILLHQLQRQNFDTTVTQVANFFGMPSFELKEDGYLDEKLTAGNLEFEILQTPGHSLDSICFYCGNEGILICGDVIFSGSVGRTDIPGGNGDQLKQSIEELSQQRVEYLLPGHMDIIKGTDKVKRNFELIKTQLFPWI